MSSVQAAKHVKVGASRLGRIWAYRQGTQWRIPITQFHDCELLPGWEQVWELIPDTATPVSVFRFLTIDRDELGQWSVRDWLAAGEPVEPVLDLARGGVWPLMVDAAFPLQSTVPAPGPEDGVTWRPEQRL